MAYRENAEKSGSEPLSVNEELMLVFRDMCNRAKLAMKDERDLNAVVPFLQELRAWGEYDYEDDE
jgi:hypothetical protein